MVQGIDNDDLGEQLGPDGEDLHGSVKARLDNMEAGKDLTPVHATSQTSFVATEASSDYAMA